MSGAIPGPTHAAEAVFDDLGHLMEVYREHLIDTGRDEAQALLARDLRDMPEWDRDALIDTLTCAVDSLAEVVVKTLITTARVLPRRGF